MSKSLNKSLIIECIASTPDRDVTGETLNIEGADISPLLEGRGYLNTDHRNDMAHTVGKVTAAKIIKSLSDAETPTQIKFWNQTQKPFIWAQGEVWDDVGHKEADAVASIYKHYIAKNEEPPIKISVEGKTLERGANGELKRTMIKGLALTLSPCNRATKSEVVQLVKSAGADEGLFKTEGVSPFFIEVQDSPYTNLLQLAETARELLSGARDAILKTEPTGIKLESPGYLERLKQMTEVFKNKAS